MQSAELRIRKRERELMNVWNSLKNRGNSPISIRGSPESSLVRRNSFPGSGPVRLEEGGGLARSAWNWEFFQFRNVLPQGSQYCFPVPKKGKYPFAGNIRAVCQGNSLAVGLKVRCGVCGLRPGHCTVITVAGAL